MGGPMAMDFGEMLTIGLVLITMAIAVFIAGFLLGRRPPRGRKKDRKEETP
jgi:K+-transporting ATPase A subunit